MELRATPGDPRSVCLHSQVVNERVSGLALAGWGADAGIYLQLVTPGGKKLFDAGWGRSGALPVVAAGCDRVARIPLGRRPLLGFHEFRRDPWVEIAGVSDPELARHEHLWLVLSLHPSRGAALRPAPLCIPLRTAADGLHGFGLFGADLDRLRRSEVMYRPGRLLVGFDPALRLPDAKRVITSRGLEVCSETYHSRTGFLVVSAPPGREAAVGASLETEGLARVAVREPLVCGLAG